MPTGLNDVKFNKQQGGLGRKLPGTDYISGLLFYTDATLPNGFSSSDRIKTIYSVADAVNLGITNTSLGETKSTGTYQFTTKFTVGDTFKLTVATIDSTNPVPSKAAAGTLPLANFTAVTADAVSTTTSATRLAAEINAGTLTHGWTATSSTATVTFTAAAGQGVFLNTGTPYVVTIVGAAAGTLTQNVVTGAYSDIDILYYHISEYFRIQPKGKLYVGLYATADVGTWASITLMQNFATGEIKQLGIYQKGTAFATSQLNGIQSVLTTLEGLHKPMIVWYGAEISGTADLTSMSTNLHSLSNPQVATTIGQDGANQGFKLFKATGKSITNVGEVLGAQSLAAVSESIAWLAKFQVASSELDTVAFANGQLWTSLSDGAITNLDNLGFCFLRKVPDLEGGTYHNRPYTAIALSNDFCFTHPNRTIYKAMKLVRAILLPETGRPVFVNADGTLTEDTLAYFKGLVKQALDVMLRDKELSNYNPIINPSQDVLGTNELIITVELQPVGTADYTTVNIGFNDILTTTA